MSLSVNRNGAKLAAGWFVRMFEPPDGPVMLGLPFVLTDPAE